MTTEATRKIQADAVAQRFQSNRDALQDIIRMAQQSLAHLENADLKHPRLLHSSILLTRSIAERATEMNQRAIVNDAVLAASPDNLLTQGTPEGALYIKAMITGCRPR